MTESMGVLLKALVTNNLEHNLSSALDFPFIESEAFSF